jgi:hypothetical protein
MIKMCAFVISTRATMWPEVEKSIKKTDFSTPLRCARNDSKSAFIKLNWYNSSFGVDLVNRLLP